MEEIVEIFSENKFQKPFEDTVYKVTCLYKGKTELYERMLIEKEYKYNSSKAFCDKKFQDASFVIDISYWKRLNSNIKLSRKI